MNEWVGLALWVHGVVLGVVCGWAMWRRPESEYPIE